MNRALGMALRVILSGLVTALFFAMIFLDRLSQPMKDVVCGVLFVILGALFWYFIYQAISGMIGMRRRP